VEGSLLCSEKGERIGLIGGMSAGSQFIVIPPLRSGFVSPSKPLIRSCGACVTGGQRRAAPGLSAGRDRGVGVGGAARGGRWGQGGAFGADPRCVKRECTLMSHSVVGWGGEAWPNGMGGNGTDGAGTSPHWASAPGWGVGGRDGARRVMVPAGRPSCTRPTATACRAGRAAVGTSKAPMHTPRAGPSRNGVHLGGEKQPCASN